MPTSSAGKLPKAFAMNFPRQHTSNGAARRRRYSRAAAGLTLIEMLVVLALLGLLASSLLPSLSYVLDRTRERDIEKGLLGSWKLARALSLARNEPAVWEVRQTDEGMMVSVAAGDGALAVRELRFDGCKVQVEAGPAPREPQVWEVIVPPHGLTESIELRITRDGKPVKVILPGIIDAAKEIPRAHGG